MIITFIFMFLFIFEEAIGSSASAKSSLKRFYAYASEAQSNRCNMLCKAHVAFVLRLPFTLVHVH